MTSEEMEQRIQQELAAHDLRVELEMVEVRRKQAEELRALRAAVTEAFGTDLLRAVGAELPGDEPPSGLLDWGDVDLPRFVFWPDREGSGNDIFRVERTARGQWQVDVIEWPGDSGPFLGMRALGCADLAASLLLVIGLWRRGELRARPAQSGPFRIRVGRA